MNGLASGSPRHAPMRHALLFSVPAAASGFFSAFVETPNTLVIWKVPIYPGLFFATAIGIALALWRTRDVIKIVMIFLLLSLTWMAACRSALEVFEYIRGALGNPGIHRWPNYTLAVCGVVGGFVGSCLTAATLALFAREFRAFTYWGRIVLTGTIAGLFLEGLSEEQLPIHLKSYYPIFLVWQISVAACIGYGIKRDIDENIIRADAGAARQAAEEAPPAPASPP